MKKEKEERWLLKTVEVAARLGVSEDTVRLLPLPTVEIQKIDGSKTHPMYRPSDVQILIDENLTPVELRIMALKEKMAFREYIKEKIKETKARIEIKKYEEAKQ